MVFPKVFGWVAVVGLLVSPAAPSLADEGAPARNRVTFQVERSRQVPNDRVRAVVGVTFEDEDPSTLAERVNRTMSWGLGRVGGAEGVSAPAANTIRARPTGTAVCTAGEPPRTWCSRGRIWPL